MTTIGIIVPTVHTKTKIKEIETHTHAHMSRREKNVTTVKSVGRACVLVPK